MFSPTTLFPCSIRKGFTLIELLVVIGVIAILMAISLAALRSAGNAASLAQCTQNLHEVSGLVNLYVGDNNGYYMQSDWGNGSQWKDALQPYLNVGSKDYVGHLPGPTGVLRCPIVQADFGKICTIPGLAARWPNYGMNVFIGPNKTTSPRITAASVAHPSTKILFMDGGFNATTPISGVQPADPSSFQDYHSGGNNILYADGHVQLWKHSQLLRAAPYTVGGTQDMWSPGH